MKITITVNSVDKICHIQPGDTLLQVLRAEGYFGAKFGGCQQGECGACTVIMDGLLVHSCSILAAQCDGVNIETIEAVGEVENQGWKQTAGLSVLQQAFIDTGAIQCGYCTPAMILAASKLLEKEIKPTEEEIRAALSSVLCRCTGYVKPVEAVMRAAAILRGEPVEPLFGAEQELPKGDATSERMDGVIATPEKKVTRIVGKSERKVDAVKLSQGKPAFTDDIEMRGMLVAKVLHSPVAHAIIKRIDTSKAKALPGVAAVLTWQDLPRVVYSTAGQSDPIPGPLDTFSLDQKVRFVGDRVAFVAAESEAIAEKVLDLIEVEYEMLPAILDSRQAMSAGAVVIHDEKEYVPFADCDPKKNLAAEIRIDIGYVEKGFAEADYIVEGDYDVPKVQQSHIEPHAVVTYWDEDDRLVIRTSTQVPFHARRMLAPVLGLPVKRIRVIKPRIGGGFGGKQEVLIEDVAAHLTIATGRPVRYVYTREEEFIAARSRHPMVVKMKTGV